MKTTQLLIVLICLIWNVNAQEKIDIGTIIRQMHKENRPHQNQLAMEKAITDFKLDPIKNAEEIDMLKGQVAMSFLSQGNVSDFEKYINQISSKFNQTSYLNMAVEMLGKPSHHSAYAETLAKRTVDLYEAYKNDSTARPEDFPKDDWNRFMKMAAYPYYQSYATVLFQNGKYKDALYFQEKALETYDLNDMDIRLTSIYTRLLEKDGQLNKAYELLLTLARSGKLDESMRVQLKNLIVKNNGDEEKTNAILDSLQQNVKKTTEKELEKTMIKNLEAPGFTLPNPEGKNVSLKDYKGKVVILDFWATWCAPCIESMPTMVQLSKKHPEVVFLFIATQETGNKIVQNVKSFIDKRKYDIPVLIDLPDPKLSGKYPVAAAYQLTGIPAKVVIDKSGNLRFSSKGFSSAQELIDELEAMISITNGL